MVGVRRRWLEGCLAFLLLAALIAVIPGSVPVARAATLEVGITGCDDVAGNPYCTINAAIADAIADDTIEIIEDGTYVENVVVDKDLTITGTGQGAAFVDGGGIGRVFDIEIGVTATITGLTIQNGDAADGGGIQVQSGADLTATAITVDSNTATAVGFSDGRGGGIYVPDGGRLTLTDSVVSNNSADLFGMGGYLRADAEDAIVISGVTFDNNDHPTDKAGGLWLQATCAASCGARQILIEESLFTNNDTQNGGGAIWANSATGNEIQIVDSDFYDNTAVGGGGGEGGALVIDNGAGSVVVSDSRFHGNEADFWGGAIAVYGNLTLVDSILGTGGFTGPLGNRVDGPFAIGGGAIAHVGDTMTVSGSSIEGNFSTSGGGGIYTEGISLSITDSLIGGNIAESNGGGIHGFGPVTITDSLVFSNQSGTTIGGAESGSEGYGGGIFARDSFTVENSSVSANTARGGEGGGISARDGADLTVLSSTISSNQAITGVAGIGNGGGIANNSFGSSSSASVNSSTIAFNDADGTGGGTFNNDSFAIANTILSGNTSNEVGLDNDNCGGTFFNDQGYNLLDNLSVDNQECGLTDGVNGNQVGTGASPIDPALGPLSGNVFTDGFESYTSACCQASFGPWSVTGDVDILGPLFTADGIDEFCRGDQCLDLGGSLGFAQPVVSRTMPGLDVGTYLLSFDLAGSQRLASETTVVTITDATGTLYTDTFVKAPSDRFTTTTVTFDKPVAGGATLSFANQDGADNEGALLDRVRVIRVDGAHAINAFSAAVDAANPAAPGSGFPACQLTDQLGKPRLNGCDIGAFEAPFNIQKAINDAPAGGAVDVPAGTFYENLTIGAGKTLEGAGPTLTIIDGNQSRTVNLTGDATLRSLQVRNGGAVESAGGNIRNDGFDLALDGVEVEGGFADEGANIYSTGTLTITGSTVRFGDAFVAGGGLYATGPTAVTDSLFLSNNADSDGGGIFNTDSGVLAIDNVVFGGNTTGIGGGALFNDGGDVTIVGSDFTNNSADDGSAIYHDPDGDFVQGTITINSPVACTVAPDIASFVPLTTFVNNDNTGNGGAIYAYGELNVYEALFSDNDAANGGGIFVESGSDPVTVGCSAFELNDATTDGGAIGSQDDGLIVVSDTLFEANTAADWGGAISDPFGGTAIDVARSIFTGNSADEGGAIYSQSPLDIVDSTLSGNAATTIAGAVYWDAFSGDFASFANLTVDGNTADIAGGMYLFGSERFTMTGSTVSNNVATSAAFTAVGGVYASSGSISNSTISGNSAPNGGVGGAFSSGAVDLNNVTVTDNSDSTATGGLGTGESQFRLAHTIVAGNTSDTGDPDCAGFLNSFGNNIIGIDGPAPFGCGTFGPSDQVGDDVTPIDPLLGPLADNGGMTLTHDLLPASPALNAGATPISAPQWDPATLAGYQLSGSAVADSNELLLAAPNDPVGSAFSTQSVLTDRDFSAQFDFRIVAQPGGDAADGVVFAVSDDPAPLGTPGGFLGVGVDDPIEGVIRGTFNGVAVEFDTWENGAAEGANDAATGNGFNHVGIDLVDTGVGTPLSSVAFGVPAGSLSDGSTWTAWIDYDELAGMLEVRASNDGTRPLAPTASTSVDLELQTGVGSAYVGFLGATGTPTISGEQRVLNFAFSQTGTCEPRDQRGVVRPVGPTCDIGSVEAALPPTVSLDLSSDPVVPTGASTIATIDLPGDLATAPTDTSDPTDDNIGSAPVANLDTQSADVEASPVANLPVANLPIANLAGAAQAVLDSVLLVDVSVDGGWEVHLAASTTGLNGRPIQSITFGEALADPGVLASLDAAGITFNDLNVQSTPIANLTIAGLALGDTLLEDLPLDLADLCDSLAGQPVNCATLGIVPPGNGGGQSIASLSIAGADISGLPVANIPVANLPIANLPVANLPVANLVLVDSPIANLPVANLPIANLGPGGLPVANLPIANVPIANLGPGGLPVANLPVANLPVANVPVANVPIANLSDPTGAPIANVPIANLTTVGGLPIANVGPDGLPVANLPVANVPIANIPVANLPALVDCSQPAVFDCNAADATVGGAFLAGVLLGTFADWIGVLTIADLIAIGATNNGAPLTLEGFVAAFVGVPLLDLVPDGQTEANLGQITLSELLDFAGMTLGELLTAMIEAGLGNEFFLGDVLLLLVNPTDYPWEDLDLGTIDLQAFDAGGGDTVFSTAIDVANAGGAAGQVTVTLPDGFLLNGVLLNGPGGSPVPITFTTSGQDIVVNIASVPDGISNLLVSAASSLSIGVRAASASANIAGVVVDDTTLITVAEVLEPNDVPEQAGEVVEDTLYLTHIASEGDIDLYKIPSVPAGSRLSVILSDMDADFDLVLYQPELPPLRPGGVVPEGIATGVSDPGGYVDGDNQIQNEITGDFPIATFTAGAKAGEPLKIYETSTQQGTSDEVITTATLQAAGDYYIQVHGANGVSSLNPYVLRSELIEPPGFLACSPPTKPFNGQGVTGSVFTPNPGPYNTLILFNERRLGDYYGAAAAADVRSALEDLAGQNALGVNAIVVPVDSNAGVASAFSDLDNDRCNPLKSNAVAAQIGQLVDDYRALYPSIEYLTIVGDDAQIPMFRVPDYTEIANESEYALSVSSSNNEVVGSLLAGFMLTDDPYGDAHPLLVDGRELYVSELPQGRLVESPAEILQSISNFTTFDGRLDPATTSTGLSTGYDFIEDAALGIAAALDADPRRTTTLLNTDNSPPDPIWDTQALINAINSTAMDILSLGAHMAHDSLLSAAEDAGGTQADLYTTADAEAQNAGVFSGTIIMSMGCHSGFSLSDVQVGATDDWPAKFSELGAVYAAETGFGYGDTEYLAFGEELMRQFAARLNGSMRIGQAMFAAKQFHAANLSQYATYDEKVIMETVLYGLPFYAVGDPAVPPPPPPILPSSTDPFTGLTVVSTSFDFGVGAPGPDGELILQTGTRGEFYTADGEAQVTPFHPIQPKDTRDVTQPGLTGTGVFIEELTSQDVGGFDPVFSRPTVDLSTREPELSLPGTFPLALPGINAYLDVSGPRDQLVMVLGQFTDTDGRGFVGKERLFTHVKANVLYGDPADVQIPTITKVTALDNSTQLIFSVKAFDAAGTGKVDVKRVYVLYKLDGVDGAWSELDLAQAAPGAPWIGAVPSLGARVEYLVQAVDGNGLVAFQSNKTAGNVSTEVPAPVPGGVEIQVDGGPAVPVYTEDPVEIEIVGAAPGAPVEVDVDGQGFQPYVGPFEVSGEGPHTITVDDSVNDPETIFFVIDTMGPQIFISSPMAQVYETGSDLTALYACTDAGSGVASCAGSVADGAPIDTSTPGRYTLSVTGIDNEGNTTNAAVEYEIADPLVLTVQPVLAPQLREIVATVDFTADSGHAHTATFDWGDGTSDVCTAADCLDAVAGTASTGHVYGVPGAFNVTVTVDHDGSGSQTVVSERVVIFDATGRFVIGNGTIESPFGSFTPQDPLDPEIGGILDFGFQAKYQRNGTLKGFADFTLEADDFELEFEAEREDLDWFVISNATAWIRGSGEIDDWDGEFEFMITTIDAQADPDDEFDSDRFRVEIWQEDGSPDGWVVYDSGFFSPPGDPALGTTELASGKIKIKDRNWPQ